MAKQQGFSAQLTQALKDYTEEVVKGIEEGKIKVAKDTVTMLREISPKDTGDYAKGWTKTTIKGVQVIHNKTDYQLTHLLEFGHLKVDGGRVESKPHIRIAEEKAIEDFTNTVKKVIQK